jgi:hypothetical protein
MGDHPSFEGVAIPAPCTTGYYGYGVKCGSAIRRVEFVLGPTDDYVDASLGLGADQGDIFGLSVVLTAWQRTCVTTTPATSALSVVVAGGGGGDDVIIGSPGADVLDGGPGRDLLLGSTGADVVRGGSGFDTASACGARSPVSLSLDGAADDGVSGQGANVADDVEDLVGGDGDDTLTGNSASNHLDGGLGDDTLDGGAGPDALDGGEGRDVLRARDGVPEALDCGPGEDAAVIDVDEDPALCETIDRPPFLELDADHDTSPRPIDCNDTNAAIRPGAAEVLDDGIDQDCDGRDAIDLDRDRDLSPRPADCDDGNAAVSPRQAELPGNAVDEDCDGIADPQPRVTTALDYAFFATRTTTRVVRLRAVGVAAQTTLRVTCRGTGCPKRAWSRTYARATAAVDLRVAGADRLRPGARLEVRMTRPGTIGKTLRFRIRSAALPSVLTTCFDSDSGGAREC